MSQAPRGAITGLAGATATLIQCAEVSVYGLLPLPQGYLRTFALSLPYLAVQESITDRIPLLRAVFWF